jgi:hypothetical protein
VDDLGIVALKADKTEEAPEIDQLLGALGNKSGTIPFYAIFPAGKPNQPILMDGILTPARIAEALRRAGPSKGKHLAEAGTQETAMQTR